MDYLKYKTFAALLGDTFRVQLGASETISLRLIEAVEKSGHEKESDRYTHRESFSILFQGPLETRLDQGTYRFFHRRLNDFALFIVPVGLDDTGCHYEAVINRL